MNKDQSLIASVTSDPQAARCLARDAYIFTYPLVMNYRTMFMQAIDEDKAMGKWLHLGLSSPADTDIVTPNNDTPYSYAWVDLRTEPWVLTMPKIEKERFYTSQWDDYWGYVLDNPGSVNDGNDGLSVLLASPSWKGPLPKGVARVIQGETDVLGTLTRTQIIGGQEDLLRVADIQASYKLEPLSSFAGTPAPKPAPTITWPKWSEGDEAKEAYWSYVSFLLPFVSPNPDDQTMHETLASLGIESGTPWDPAALAPAVREAMQQGLEDGRAELKKLSEGGIDAARFFGTRKRVGTNYMDRALGVYMGIFGNVKEVSVYLSMPADAEGTPLDGGRSTYTLSFTREQMPPVDYFWSITMYKLPQRLLVDNPIHRYSIGSATTGLQTNEDGSLVIYVGKDSPGTAKESNWLPAPDGPFWTVMRCYGPGQSIVDGNYKRPDYVARSLNK
ncbi:DUF1254 domain-containing protein [Synechococcus sp. Lug-A]|uniref:DUF1254 domain-containing protein n=1 Tax=Synechococcus sp. Lug-A TaxID=2823740 RepID=UPI0020CFC3EC|nr:DUF1214 domain-containing protein [Synechococcus sp. Lug-A]MCP9847655.1 DUF1254 domain-containing protein [Synechococcus sp. Lug-A]